MLDRTGLTGLYQWDPQRRDLDSLGLKITPATDTMDVVVIENAEQPGGTQ